MIYQLRGEYTQCREEVNTVNSLAKEHGFVGGLWLTLTAVAEASVLAYEECGEAAINQVQAALLIKGQKLFRPYCFASLAEFSMRFGNVEEGLTAVTDGLALVKQTREIWWEAELHRLKGELILLQGGDEPKVEDCFHQASKVADQLSARSLSLRAAASMTRLRMRQGRSNEARELLTGG